MRLLAPTTLLFLSLGSIWSAEPTAPAWKEALGSPAILEAEGKVTEIRWYRALQGDLGMVVVVDKRTQVLQRVEIIEDGTVIYRDNPLAPTTKPDPARIEVINATPYPPLLHGRWGWDSYYLRVHSADLTFVVDVERGTQRWDGSPTDEYIAEVQAYAKRLKSKPATK